MPGAALSVEKGLGMTFMSMAVAMICKLLNEKVVLRLPVSMLWGNMLEEWVNMAQKDYRRIISEQWESYPLQQLNSVPAAF